MKRFLLCAGVQSSVKSLSWLRRAVEVRPPDGVLFAGGVLAAPRHYAARQGTAWGLTHEDGLLIEQFFETLGRLGVFCAVIPGPADTPLEDFLRMGMHAEIESPGVHLAHATVIEKGDMAVCGLGGNVSEANATDPDMCSRTLAEYYLRPLWTAKQPHKVLLLSAPPPGPLGGDHGSKFTADLIDSYHPNLCVVAGPSEQRGSQRFARTLVINPGRLADGWAAWLDWNRPVDEQVEVLDLRHPDPTAVPEETGVGD
jgi:Icc-related predicted phosphoesterase